jgi:hypothetical protein
LNGSPGTGGISYAFNRDSRKLVLQATLLAGFFTLPNFEKAMEKVIAEYYCRKAQLRRGSPPALPPLHGNEFPLKRRSFNWKL